MPMWEAVLMRFHHPRVLKTIVIHLDFIMRLPVTTVPRRALTPAETRPCLEPITELCHPLRSVTPGVNFRARVVRDCHSHKLFPRSDESWFSDALFLLQAFRASPQPAFHRYLYPLH